MIFRLEIENFGCFRDLQVVDLEVAENVPDIPGRFGSIAPGGQAARPEDRRPLRRQRLR